MPHIAVLTRYLSLFAAATAFLACSDTNAAARQGRGPSADSASAVALSGGVIDSILPMEEQIRRFRLGIDSVSSFSGGSPSRVQLVRAFVSALEARDSAVFASLALTRAEFAWLYFPSHPYARPPYEMPPGLFWLQVASGSERGIARLLTRLGGKPLGYRGLICRDTARAAHGDIAITDSCRVVISAESGGPDTVRMFGSIAERDGRFKFVSYANEF
jgi:hypothetical protein